MASILRASCFVLLLAALAVACSNGDEPEISTEGFSEAAPVSGDGWRLLYAGGTQAWGTTLATHQDAYDWIWNDSGFDEKAPPVDFDEEIAIWFATGHQDCLSEFDRLIFDDDNQVIYPFFTFSQEKLDALDVPDGGDVVCDDVGNFESHVVAVERTSLLSAPFAVQPIKPGEPLPRGRKLVSVDLRTPGSIATEDQFGPDPGSEKERHTTTPIAAGGSMDSRFPALYELDLSCDRAVLGPFNTVMWYSVNRGTDKTTPEPWAQNAIDDQLETLVYFEDEPLHLRVTAGGHTEHYEPAPTTATSDCP